ncbi:MAG: H-NS histone family protein [Azonexus sp.]|jgi:DNA-binding protein H-NS|nr:H-NS histone family protein [Azonexus sp.]
MDIDKMSLAELEALSQKLPQQIQRRRAENRAAVEKQLRELAQSHGFTLEDFFVLPPASKKPRAPVAPIKPKYRNPNDFSLMWSGRGRKPLWVEKWLSEGGSMDELTIPDIG